MKWIRRFGRTRSEQRTNAEAETWESPRGNGPSASKGKDGIARDQLAAKILQESGFEGSQSVDMHDGRTLDMPPLDRNDQYERIAPGWQYNEERRKFLKRAVVLGGAFGAVAVGSGMIGKALASPGAANSGSTFSSTDIDAKRIGGVRYATEFDTASHAGTGGDPFTQAAIINALADSGAFAVALAAVQFNLASGLSYDGPFGNPVSNKSLLGMGPATYLHHTGSDTQVFSLTNVLNWKLYDFKIDTTSATTDAFLLGLAQEILLQNIQVRSFSGGAAVRLYQTQYCHVFHLDAYNSGCLYGLYFTGQSHPILGGSAYNLRDDVIGCNIRATATNGVGAEILRAHNLQFIADSFEECPVAGVRLNAPAATPAGQLDGNIFQSCSFEGNPISLHIGVNSNNYPRATEVIDSWFGGAGGGTTLKVDYARATLIRDCFFENSGTNTITLTANQLWASLENIMGGSADVTISDASSGAYYQSGLNRAGSAVFHQIPAPETIKISNLQPDATTKSGIAIRTKAGVPSDTDFTTPVDGLLCFDTSDNRLYYRRGGAWHYISESA